MSPKTPLRRGFLFPASISAMNDPGRKIAPPTITVENVNLEHFEALVYSRQYEEAGRDVLRNLMRLKVGG
jgi:hypothetical protein